MTGGEVGGVGGVGRVEGGPTSPTSLTDHFGAAILRTYSSCGDQIIDVTAERAHDILQWLRDTEGQEFNYLVDLTAVDYRDPERPLEVVYQLRSLHRKVDLRRVRQARTAAPFGKTISLRWSAASASSARW